MLLRDRMKHLVIWFTNGPVYISMLFSQILPPSPLMTPAPSGENRLGSRVAITAPSGVSSLITWV